MKHSLRIIGVACTLAFALGTIGSEAAAQDIDFSKAEDAGNQFIDFLRGPLATIVLVLGFAIFGYLAAMNRMSWIWAFGVVVAAVFIFGGPAFVDGLRSILS